MRRITSHSMSGHASRRQGRAVLVGFSLALAALVPGSWLSLAHAQLGSGDILVIDRNAGTTSPMGWLFRVKAATGVRNLINDFGNMAQGPFGSEPVGVAVHPDGSVLVIDQSGGTGGRCALFRVQPATVSRTILSDFGNIAQGPLGGRAAGVAVAANGSILVTDREPSGGQPRGVLFQVNSSTGARTIVSDFGNAAQGPLGADPTGVVVGTGNAVWVIDPNAGAGGLGALFRVNLTTGNRTLVSDFGNAAQGPLGTTPVGVALDAAGGIYVVDRDAGTSFRSALFSVDPATGARIMVSDFGNPAQGPGAQEVTGVVVNSAGNIVVVDEHDGATGFSGLLLRVNPATGLRTLVSDFGDLAQGPRGADPTGLALVSTCGDNNPDFTEECDDGNTLDGDGCSALCQVEPGEVACAKRIATWVGTPGDDTIVGTSGADVIHGLGGNDTLYGGAGRDIICGGNGDDVIRGGSSNDILEGGSGNDILIGGNGKDILRGGSGDDVLRGGENSDTCDGGPHVTRDTVIDCERVINVP